MFKTYVVAGRTLTFEQEQSQESLNELELYFKEQDVRGMKPSRDKNADSCGQGSKWGRERWMVEGVAGMRVKNRKAYKFNAKKWWATKGMMKKPLFLAVKE